MKNMIFFEMKRVFLVVVLLGAFILLTCWLLIGNEVYVNTLKSLRNSNGLENILDIEVEGDSIFFLETSFSSFEHGVVGIHPRAACAVESAALHHPHRSVYAVFVYPNITQNITIDDKFLRTLLRYSNVKIVYAVVGEYVAGTPVENLYRNRIIDSSPYWMTHYSDVLRTLTLFKYGGVYLDSDMVVLKSFDALGNNFIALETGGIVGSSVAGLENVGFGREFLITLLNDLSENYQPNKWSENGPLLYTRWGKVFCNTTDLATLANKKCSSMWILSPQSFFPVYGTVWEKLFDENYTKEFLEKSKDSYAVHFWNKLSSQKKLRLDSKAPYAVLARKHCPKVYKLLYTVF